MIDSMKRITIVTGHYGSGKTNFAVNLAVDLCRKGKSVVLVDLDIVNPYFRSADFKEQLTEMGIEMICPVYANTNLDIPALGADIYSVFNKVSVFRYRVEKEKCVHCGKCRNICQMEVDPTEDPNSAECIRCGRCKKICPTQAIRCGFAGKDQT